LIDRYAQRFMPTFGDLSPQALRFSGLGLWVLAYLVGRPGLVNNPGQSPTYWAHLCHQSSQACERFYALWKIRCDPPNDDGECIQTTRTALEIGCDAEAENACSRLAFHLVKQTDDPDAAADGLEQLVALCHGGDNSACITASEVLAMTENTPSQRRLHLLRTACHRKDGEGCERLAILLAPTAQREADRRRVSEYLFIASQEDRPVAQTMLAVWLLEGKVPGKTSTYRARVLLKKACRKKLDKACSILKSLPTEGAE